jgi:8-oxo-dGTP pyrophosphatase MutT (NUDIX family)
MMRWNCLNDARRSERGGRWPFLLDGRRAGSIDAAARVALAAWPQWFREEAGGAWALHAEPAQRDVVFAEVNAALRAQGLVRAWRDEPFALWNEDGAVAAVIERASSRFWGAQTLGAHINGYVAGADGRPADLWIARRARNKPTDPGRLDNLVGSGVPHGQTPRQAVCREAWEEAGLRSKELHGLVTGRVIELACDIPEGWQHEWLFVYDLALPPGRVPQNQDGEVAEHQLLPIADALQRAADGEMTTDAALATLDFALRHQLLPADEAGQLAPRFEALLVDPSRAVRFDPPIDSTAA